MAEKASEPISREDEIVEAKTHYATGYRNYVVGAFFEAAEELSRSCELFAKLYGDESEEVAIPNLFYGKTLIELAQQGENKLLVLPEHEEDDDNDNDNEDEDEDEDVANDEDENEDEEKSSETDIPSLVSNGPELGQATASSASTSTSNEPQPGTSYGAQNSNGNGNDVPKGNDEEESNENLQYAWEALEMAANIFRRLGKRHDEYLAEAHYGLGEISMENQNCSEAIRDYNIAFDIFSKLEPIKERCLAEIKYKTGLCHYTAMAYDESITDFQQSADYMQNHIQSLLATEQTPEIEKTIEDLFKVKEDILNKIVEVQETKDLLRSNLISKGGGYSALLAEDGNGEASSAQVEKPKATDISHLIKRKKPDTANESSSNSDAPSPAKKPAI